MRVRVGQGEKAMAQVDGRGRVHQRQSVFDVRVVVQGGRGEDEGGL